MTSQMFDYAGRPLLIGMIGVVIPIVLKWFYEKEDSISYYFDVFDGFDRWDFIDIKFDQPNRTRVGGSFVNIWIVLFIGIVVFFDPSEIVYGDISFDVARKRKIQRP